MATTKALLEQQTRALSMATGIPVESVAKITQLTLRVVAENMYRQEDMTVRKVAAMLGYSHAAVQKWLEQGRKLVREEDAA